MAARCFAGGDDAVESVLRIAVELDVDLLVVPRPSAAAAAVVDGARCDVLLVA